MVHQNRFANNADKVGAIKYVLSGTALQWFNGIPQANMPANVNDLQRDMFAKFRIAKTRLQWKKELGALWCLRGREIVMYKALFKIKLLTIFMP